MAKSDYEDFDASDNGEFTEEDRNAAIANLPSLIQEKKDEDFLLLLMYLDHEGAWLDLLPNYASHSTRFNSLLNHLSDYAEHNGWPAVDFPTGTIYSAISDEGVQSHIEINQGGEVQQYIRDQIDQGRPILVTLYSLDLTIKPHMVLAYDYDRATGEIYAHFGWNPEDTRRPLVYGGYTHITSMYVVDFSAVAHVHSDNYIINGVGYCGCGHRAIGHDYTYSSEVYDDQYHANYCSCGEFVLERHDDRASGYTILDGAHVAHCICGDVEVEHDFESKYYYSAEKHRVLCRCGAEGEMEDHQYDVVSSGSEVGHILLCECGVDTYEYHDGTEGGTYYDESHHVLDCECGALVGHDYTHSYEEGGLTTHTATCVCGAPTTEEHTLTYTYVDTSFHKCTCSKCGHEHTQAHAVQEGGMNVCIGCKKVIRNPSGPGQVIHSVNQAQYVSANGSYILPNGIIVLVDEDVEAYLAGTLTFYLNGTQVA